MKIQPERYAGQDTLFLCCIAAGILMLIALFAIWGTAEPQTSEVIVVENITPEPTPLPEPEPTLSPEQFMEQNGGLHNGTWLSMRRDNVSGYKDMSLHARVWGYREYGIINWRSVSWGRIFQQGAGEGNKFLFVFVESYQDDHMATMWGIQPHQWLVEINGTLYKPTEELLPEIRIAEFDEIWDARHVENIKPYGFLRTVKSVGSGKETAEPLGYLKAGYSQSWCGYVPFVIPANARAEDIKVHLNSASLMEPHWWTLN